MSANNTPNNSRKMLRLCVMCYLSYILSIKLIDFFHVFILHQYKHLIE